MWHAEVQRRRADRAHAHVGRPSARGLGIGHDLLTELEDRAATNGSRTIHLKSNKTLIEAIAMYRPVGYPEVDAFNDEPYATAGSIRISIYRIRIIRARRSSLDEQDTAR